MARPGRDSAQPVPTVDFYGDATPWSTSALLHSEPLIERSRLHAWRIRPHRHQSLTQLFWLRRGAGTARFDAEPALLTAPCLAVVPEQCVHEFRWRRQCDGFALSIASSLVSELKRIDPQGMVLRRPLIVPAKDDGEYIDALFERIHAEYLGDRPLKEISLDCLVQSVTVWLARRSNTEHVTRDHGSRAGHHHERFTSLLERHYRSQWTVTDYAHEIGITPAHLNAVCHRVAGRTALEIVHERLMLAARRELTYTDKAIADVAASLGFAEPSYFSRFFRRKMNMAPKEYRRRSGTLTG